MSKRLISAICMFLIVAAVVTAQTYTTWTATPAADPVSVGSGLGSTTIKTVTAVSSIIPALPYRTDLLIVHESGDPVYVNIGGTTASTTASYIKIASGGSLSMKVPAVVPISVVTATAQAVLSVVQTVNK